jgi:hypothetical protein
MNSCDEYELSRGQMLMFLAVIGMGLLAGIYAKQQKTAILADRTAIVARLAPEAASAWNEIRVLENMARQRMRHLKSRLEAVDRDPQSDKDFIKLDREFESIRAARAELEDEINEIFLSYEKQVLAGNSNEPARLAELRKQGLKAAEEAKNTIAE